MWPFPTYPSSHTHAHWEDSRRQLAWTQNVVFWSTVTGFIILLSSLIIYSPGNDSFRLRLHTDSRLHSLARFLCSRLYKRSHSVGLTQRWRQGEECGGLFSSLSRIQPNLKSGHHYEQTLNGLSQISHQSDYQSDYHSYQSYYQSSVIFSVTSVSEI